MTTTNSAVPKHDDGSAFLQFQFDTAAQQLDTVKLGVWLFLASEILFFGGLFVAYAVYRGNHPDMFYYGQFFLDWRMGALNTLVLIGSSLSAAWSVRAAQLNQQKTLQTTLIITVLLACVFMVVKYLEYSHKIAGGVVWGDAFAPTLEMLAELPPAAQALPVPGHMGRFFAIYYAMTGLHGIHVLVGIGMYFWLLRRTRRGDFGPGYFGPVEGVALYWHLVDMIWIFLFPLLYLIG